MYVDLLAAQFKVVAPFIAESMGCGWVTHVAGEYFRGQGRHTNYEFYSDYILDINHAGKIIYVHITMSLEMMPIPALE